MPIGRGGTNLTNEMINNLIDVGGIQCDYCKKKDVSRDVRSARKDFTVQRNARRSNGEKESTRCIVGRRGNLKSETWYNMLV